MFDLEVFYFLVSIKKLESSPCSRQNAVSVSIVLFPDRREERAPKVFQRPYCCCPSWPRNGGFCLCVGSSSVSLSVSTLWVYLCLFVSVRRLYATCFISSPFVNIDFQNSVCTNDFTRRLVNVMKIKLAPLDSSLVGCDSYSQKSGKLVLHHLISRHNVKYCKIHFKICFLYFVKN